MKRFAIIFLLTLCCVAFAPKAMGQVTIKSLNEQIARAEAEIKRNEALLNKIKGEKAVTLNELKLVASRISNRMSIVASLNEQIEICRRNIAAKEEEIAVLEERIATLKQEYAKMIYAAYKNSLLNNSLAFLFSARDFQEATLRIDYMRRYNRLRAERRPNSIRWPASWSGRNACWMPSWPSWRSRATIGTGS